MRQHIGMECGAHKAFSLPPAPLTDLHLEVVEGVLIDVLHLVHQLHGEVCNSLDVGLACLVVGGVVEARGSHVGAPYGLDLFQLPEPILTDDLDRRGSDLSHVLSWGTEVHRKGGKVEESTRTLVL